MGFFIDKVNVCIVQPYQMSDDEDVMQAILLSDLSI